MDSKAWDWNISSAPWWEEPAPEVYPLLSRWKKSGLTKLLDLGCGIGRHSILFAKNGFEVSACDLSENGVEKLNRVIKDEDLNIETKVSDMLSLPYGNDTFDSLIAFHTIYHTDDDGIRQAIAEIKRVLKTGGEAFITFNTQNGSSFKDPKYKHVSENTVIKTEGNEANIPHFYATKEDVEKLLQDFKILEFTYKEEYYPPDYVGTHYYVLVGKS